MPIARIITQSAAAAAMVAERLRAEGYTVETVSPLDKPLQAADLEIRIDQCATEEALILAAEMVPEGGRILVAPGALSSAQPGAAVPQTPTSASQMWGTLLHNPTNPTSASQMWGTLLHNPTNPTSASQMWGTLLHKPTSASQLSDVQPQEEPAPAVKVFGQDMEVKRGWLASWWKRRAEQKTDSQAASGQLAPTFNDLGPDPVSAENATSRITGMNEVPSQEAEREQARLAAEQERARRLELERQAEAERGRRAELERQAEAERVRLAEEASRIAREQELERQRREAERERMQREAEAQRLRQEAEARRIREQEETDRRLAEAAQARAATQREVEERRRAEEMERARRMEEARAAEQKSDVERYENPQPSPSLRSGSGWGTQSRDKNPHPFASRKGWATRRKGWATQPRGPSRMRTRQREWQIAIAVAAVFAILLMLGWSAVQNPRPASPLSNSDLTNSSNIKQEVPFGPVTLPPPAPPQQPAGQAATKPKPTHPSKQSRTYRKPAAIKRTKKPQRTRSSAEDDVTVRHFRSAPQPSARPRNSQAELRRYTDE